jgi:hypothetical protein
LNWGSRTKYGPARKTARFISGRRAAPGPGNPRIRVYDSAYVFGAFCPARDTGAGRVMPRANTEAMAYHLEEISATVAPGAHAIVLIT